MKVQVGFCKFDGNEREGAGGIHIISHLHALTYGPLR